MHMAELIANLNADLKNEWKHLCFYLYHASAITGLHAHEFKEFFLEQAASEMKHVQQFADMLIGLGAEPVFGPNSFNKCSDVRAALAYAAEMEAEVVLNYTRRIEQLSEIPEDATGAIAADKKWLEIFLEEQIKDSREDLDHIRQLLAGA